MKIAFVGDVMLGRLVNESLKHCHPIYPWGNTLSILQSADLRICNLECVLSDIGNPWSASAKVFHFRSDEKNITTLQAPNINIVSLANNHVLDYEYEAIDRMLGLLNKHEVLHAGAGKNLAEAAKPAFCQVNDQKIAVIAFTDNEPGWEAKEDKPGIFYVPVNLNNRRMEALLQHIESVRKTVDFLIVSAHWGPNWGYDPPEEHRLVARAMIDAGANLIFGHSGHVFRGIEIYKNSPIIYSAGDFIDDYAVDEIEKNDESFIFILEKELDSKPKLYLYPIYIRHFQANLAPHTLKNKIFAKMKDLCSALGSSLECFADYALLDL